jgi:4-amino-4-deoxychorismate lyase
MSASFERLFLGGERIDALPGDARGFAYGDGLFETMRVHRGLVPWWPMHMARLLHGASRLALALPDPAHLEREARALFDDEADGVLKLVVSRGGGGRGYAPPPGAAPLWRLSRHALPAPARTGGLVVRWCAIRLALQPALAGLKHCNRLEQVLARAEWTDPGIDEGLMLDAQGHIACATGANVFVLHGERWSTPRVDRCGVAGTCRAWLLDQAGAIESDLVPDALQTADAVLLCNAVRGILPVARLEARTWAPHPAVAELRARLAHAHPGFAADQEGT